MTPATETESPLDADADELVGLTIIAIYQPKEEYLRGTITRVWESSTVGRLIDIDTGSVVRSFKPADLAEPKLRRGTVNGGDD